MGQSAIEINSLSKAYIIQHNNESASSSSLRDVITRKVNGIFKTKPAGDKAAVQTEKFWALQDINFNIEQGSRVGILGGNGAGKSTLLKIISKITEPTSGRMIVNGKVVSLLEVGTGFHAELTGRENIFLNGVILGMKRAEIRRKFDEIVDFAEVEQFLDTPVKRYSSGMYMRLAFAVAAHLEPEILIIDEVLAVGDSQFQKKCIAKMDEISRVDGRTVLFVSHNLEAVSSFCTTGLYLKKGKLVTQGSIESVCEEYATDLYGKTETFHSSNHKKIYFEKISLRKSFLAFNEPLELNCDIYSEKSESQYIIGITIKDTYENKVGSTLLKNEEGLVKGINSIQINLPLANVVPGNYKITIAIALDERLNNEDVVWDYPSFMIIASEPPQHFMFPKWHPSWGGILLHEAFISNRTTKQDHHYEKDLSA
jgi:lipopolysaccharide transport system ATP-binding protein